MWFFIFVIILIIFFSIVSVLRRIARFLFGNPTGSERFDSADEEHHTEEGGREQKTKKFSKDVGEYVNYEDVDDKK